VQVLDECLLGTGIAAAVFQPVKGDLPEVGKAALQRL